MEVSITGARILWVLPIFGGIPITETLLNCWLVMGLTALACVILTRGLRPDRIGARQAAAELLVTAAERFTEQHLGTGRLAPFVAALFSLSVLGSLLGVTGLFPPTADLSTTLAWALTVFLMITAVKLRSRGLRGYLRSFTQPVALLTPFNLLSELSAPVSMSFRHFGSIVSGTVISELLYAALSLASRALTGGAFPLLAVGLPALLGLYFDWFAAFLQAFLFCMLTLLYLANAGEET